ncbi:uncharacterized protein LOC143354122 [Halictus rubicundus]|uniref:uncharacterized protein LOC143354122 n=1 Tax=Halictus rubicundus TaxID=77578 RepID=UPI004035F7C6
MEQSFNECIEQLRKRSRLLLARVDQSSKRVKEEYKKLYSQSLISRDNHCTGNRTSCVSGNIKSWRLRNDSSGVGAALCIDYSTDSSGQSSASMPNLGTARRVVISSKKHSEPLKTVHRKPVRECYCNSEVKKTQLRSTRTQRKPDPGCKYCKSHIEFRPAIVRDSPRKSLASPPISCETLRRVQRIDYAPKSQFLRNVQSKATLLQSGDCPETCPKSPCCRRARPQTRESQNENLTMSRTVPRVATDLVTSDEERSSKTPKQSRKYLAKRTVTSKKPVSDSSKTKSSPKDSTKNKRLVCHCCHGSKMVQQARSIKDNDDVDSEDYQHTVCVSNLDQVGSNDKDISDNELRELRKFREQNYFDTHGSSHTLHSSKSSGSLEQYLLNDRLFPEPSRTIHKKDLVVTMPACATLQRKRIHYFPRYIVRQDKNNCNNYKKKRCQTCPLTGHAIDLGVTKMRPPLNSLALKYQKRLP